MKLDKCSSFKKAEEAIDYLYQHWYVHLYNIDRKDLDVEISKLYKMIADRNKQIENLNDQYLPTNPYYYRGIYGCLGVQAAEIDVGLYKTHHDRLSLFTGWKTSVLHGDNIDVRPGLKALSSLALMAEMLHDKN